ncbi:MAG: hypothetical protein R3F65_15815 [bacterium]|nr:hypothetical protein [Myxococcales bacterium]MCB9552122.1 hypothetical protein [Myxococcales bacterium]
MWRSCTVLALAALAGCAPAAHLRPITPFAPDRVAEVGVGYVAVGPRPVGHDAWSHGGQAWASAAATSWLDVALIGAFDDTAGTAGLAVRWRALEGDRGALGLGVELGIGWAALEVPVAVRVVDGLWLYSSPQLGSWGTDPTVRVPVGVDVAVIDALRLRTEAQLNYPDFDPYQRRLQLGFGLGWQL